MFLVLGKQVDRGEGKDLTNKIPPKSPKRKRYRLCMNESHGQGHTETKPNFNKIATFFTGFNHTMIFYKFNHTMILNKIIV